jgi:hypothetical protein
MEFAFLKKRNKSHTENTRVHGAGGSAVSRAVITSSKSIISPLPISANKLTIP